MVDAMFEEREGAREAGRLWGVVHDGLWFHVGPPEGLDETEAMLAELRHT